MPIYRGPKPAPSQAARYTLLNGAKECNSPPANGSESHIAILDLLSPILKT